MTQELKEYLLRYCRDWMLPEEVNALRQTMIDEKIEIAGPDSPVARHKQRLYYGFDDPKTKKLAGLGREQVEDKIAERLVKDHGVELINNCPKCGRLARTPRARQCRYCGHSWH